MLDTVAVDSRLPKSRSRLTNDPRRLSAGVDMRSIEARRFADIYDALSAEFPDGDAIRLREIALLRFEHERAQATGAVSLEDTVRVYNAIERKERQLRAARRRPPMPPSIDEIAARHRAKAAAR